MIAIGSQTFASLSGSGYDLPLRHLGGPSDLTRRRGVRGGFFCFHALQWSFVVVLLWASCDYPSFSLLEPKEQVVVAGSTAIVLQSSTIFLMLLAQALPTSQLRQQMFPWGEFLLALVFSRSGDSF